MATDLYTLTDRLLGGDLQQRLAEWRAADMSYEAIGRLLAVEHQIDVTGQTVRNWCHQQGVADRSKAVS